MTRPREPLPKFNCSFCGHETASRVTHRCSLSDRLRRSYGPGIYRRRVCLECLGSFATFEALNVKAVVGHRAAGPMPRVKVPRARSGLVCPTCQAEAYARVTHTRAPVGGEVRRRRLCAACAATFSTIERLLPARRELRHRPTETARPAGVVGASAPP